MRNHILILSLVSSAVAVATSDKVPKLNQLHSQSTATVVRDVVATAAAAYGSTQQPAAPIRRRSGVVRVYSPRQYPQPGGTRDIGREREQIERERDGAFRAHHLEPGQIPGSSSSGDGKNGGVSVTNPAFGADANDGGDNESSPDGASADGLGLNSFLQKVSAVGQTPSYNAYDSSNSPETPSAPESAEAAETTDSAFAVDPEPEAPVPTYTPHHPAKRSESPRITTFLASRKRDNMYDIGDVVDDTGDDTGDDDSSDENSNHDGADGQSVDGQETDGSGTNGGHGHAGTSGSSEGGHVYNYPSRN